MFVNGLPLAVIELKNPETEQTDIWDAFSQLQTYQGRNRANLFATNAVLVVSDGAGTHRFARPTPKRMLPWRTIANEDAPALAAGDAGENFARVFAGAFSGLRVQHCAVPAGTAEPSSKKIAGLPPVPRVCAGSARHGDCGEDRTGRLLEVRRFAPSARLKPARARRCGLAYRGSARSITMGRGQAVAAPGDGTRRWLW